MKARLAGLGIGLGLSLILYGYSLTVRAEIWTFGVIGDVPYSDRERHELPFMLESMVEHNVALIAHVGDIKSGKRRCDNDLYDDRKAVFNAVRVPFIFVPGDNEWSDCGRLTNGAYDPLERLATLRKVFFPDAYSLGQSKLPLETQGTAYPEHKRFQLGPVLFVTLNVPGGNNNFGAVGRGSEEYRSRNKAVLEWMHESFLLARRKKLLGVVVLMQANPYFDAFNQGLAYSGYRALLEQLRYEVGAFPGKVAVIHGDTHQSRIDHPLRDAQGKTMTTLTRVETFGYPIMGWTRGVIDTDNPALFRFETHPWVPLSQRTP